MPTDLKQTAPTRAALPAVGMHGCRAGDPHFRCPAGKAGRSSTAQGREYSRATTTVQLLEPRFLVRLTVELKFIDGVTDV
jgi:hypothetical protein